MAPALVPGAGTNVGTLLESVGHKVTCLDHVGAGVDPSEPDQVASFEQYNRP